MSSKHGSSESRTKRILFVTGTRADFGKVKPLIQQTSLVNGYETHVAITGMHLSPTFGETWREVVSSLDCQTHLISNSADTASQDIILARTIESLGNLVKAIPFDLIVVHGDRVEALASALVGLLNDIPIAHIEGGEVSGTVDEMLRHATSKLSTYHLVANESAKVRLMQMGEAKESVRIIGSPDLDVMASNDLPSLEEVRNHYEIGSQDFGIVMFHPNVTNPVETKVNLSKILDFLNSTDKYFVVIYPNNDPGYQAIIEALTSISKSNIRVLPSMRFEYFLTLLKFAKVMIGNSSAGIREAPFFGTPTINIGTRQNKRSALNQISNVLKLDETTLENETSRLWGMKFEKSLEFGDGTSAAIFTQLLSDGYFESMSIQKSFVDISFS
jgi:UDP-N-acetylglucosamine 2-epimerase (hydrolysing)